MIYSCYIIATIIYYIFEVFINYPSILLQKNTKNTINPASNSMFIRFYS